MKATFTGPVERACVLATLRRLIQEASEHPHVTTSERENLAKAVICVQNTACGDDDSPQGNP